MRAFLLSEIKGWDVCNIKLRLILGNGRQRPTTQEQVVFRIVPYERGLGLVNLPAQA